MRERILYEIDQHDDPVCVDNLNAASTENLASCLGIGLLYASDHPLDRVGFMCHLDEDSEDDLLPAIDEFITWVQAKTDIALKDMEVGVCGRIKLTPDMYEDEYSHITFPPTIDEVNNEIIRIDSLVLEKLVIHGCCRSKIVSALSDEVGRGSYIMQVDCYNNHILIIGDRIQRNKVKKLYEH